MISLSPHPRSRLPWTALLALSAALCGTAHAEGTIELRLYSVPPPLELVDSLSVTLHYQAKLGPPSTGGPLSLDLSAERNRVTFGARYSSPHHILQATGRRAADPQADRSDLSATVIYTYVPQARPDGAALTSATALYVLSGNQAPTSGVLSQTVGVAASVRLSSSVNSSTTANATAVRVATQDGLIWSGTVSESLSYAQGTANAYLAPSVSLQNAQARVAVSGGGAAKLTPDLTASGSAFWSAGSPPSANAALTYDAKPWKFRGTVTAGANVAFGVGADVALPALNASATVNLTPATRTPVYAATLSKKVGGLQLSAGATVTAPPDAPPTIATQVSVSGQQKPWQGGLNLSYTRAPKSSSGSATGTLTYAGERFGAQLALGLNLAATAGTPAVTGQANLTMNYAVNSRLDVTGSARYERSAGADATAAYRYGVGLRYRFGDKESQ